MKSGINLRKEWGGHVGKYQEKRFYGRVWPNGNFSLGLGPVGQAAAEMENDSEDNQAAWGDSGDMAAAIAALNSSNGTKSHKGKSDAAQRGLTGISAYGQQMLRSACYLLERDYGNQDLCFATLTVPTLPPGARYLLAANWSEIVRQLLQWVSRRLMRGGRPTKVVGCSEIQSRRLATYGQAYLHFHLVFPAHSNSAGHRWAVEWAALRAWWEKTLTRFSCCDLPHHPRVELSTVRKSAERYMGKYLSKGSGEALDAFIEDVGVEAVPPAWWFMTADMRSQVKDETLRGPNIGELLHIWVDQALEDGTEEYWEWIRPVMIQFTDRPVHVGWCGRLTQKFRSEFAEFASMGSYEVIE